jgi:hypothetical protein
MYLLTTSSSKINKSKGYGYKTYVLHLSPSTLSGVGNMCPKASAGCIAACLNYAGHGGMLVNGTNKVQEARKRRTVEYVKDREYFMMKLYCDIRESVLYCKQKGVKPVIRLNGTSDIIWRKIKVNGYSNIFEAFPDVQFYDYTAILDKPSLSIPNYHLTFSRKESNEKDCQKASSLGLNIAVVFDKLPSEYMGMPVMDGDISDLRHLDMSGVVIGLKAKGRARKDVSGFVVKTNQT